MQVELNNKKFIARYDDNDKLIIRLKFVQDVLFFKKWQNERLTALCKNDYIKNVRFKKITNEGVFKNCFPILSSNEDCVQLIYDCVEVWD